MTIYLREVSFSEDDGRGVDYIATDDIPKVGGGQDSGRVMVRLDVDAGVPIVYTDLGTTGDLDAIERSIETLKLLHGRLMALYGDDHGSGAGGSAWTSAIGGAAVPPTVTTESTARPPSRIGNRR